MALVTVVETNSSDELVAEVVQRLVSAIKAKHDNNQEFHLSLTGGRAGSSINQLLFTAENMELFNPRLLHIWWSDERYLPRGDTNRNDFSLPVDLPTSGLKHHYVHGPEESASAQESAEKYGSDLHLTLTTRFCASNTLMDVCLLSIGPDGHVASLFPGHLALDSTKAITEILDSPKPPPARVTWTYPTINASESIWLIATGAEKKDQVTQVINGADFHLVPAAGVKGKSETMLFVDSEALGK